MKQPNRLKLAVFDLDGTLYEDTHHFDYFAKLLQGHLSPDSQASFWSDYEEAKEDRHALRVGRVYDAVSDLILEQRHLQVQRAFRWDGEELPEKTVQKLYAEQIEIDMVRFLSIGDLWWIPIPIAIHYGATTDQTTKAFLDTRAYMMTDAYQMKNNPALKETLVFLKQSGLQLALMTNSPGADSEQIIRKLGIAELFDFKQFLSQKPTLTTARLQDMQSRFSAAPHETISVGDNWINEIDPANSMGCETLFIDAHGIGESLPATYRVRSLDAALQVLRSRITDSPPA